MTTVFLVTSYRTLAATAFLGFSIAPASHGHGAYHEVVSSIQAALKTSPDDAALRYKLAEAHAGHEEWPECLEEITKVERLAPGVHPTGYLRGFALHHSGQNDQAKEVLDLFLSTHPEHAQALATRGRVFTKLDRPADAAADLQAALKFSPSPESELIEDLALAYQKIGKPEEASRTIDEALKSSADPISLLDCALRLETEAGMWDSALRRIDGLQKAAPRPEPWMAKRAELLAKAGRTEDARAAWISLRDHLAALPSLERGTPQNSKLLIQVSKALGDASPKPVSIPPAH